MSAEFAINNKVHSITKLSPFIANYRREMRMEVDLRRKRKDGKGNGICGENEKDTGRSRSGIEKGIRGNEETSR